MFCNSRMFFLFCFALFLTAITLPVNAFSQQTFTKETEAKLQMKVQLRLGSTTLETVTASLSKQSGLKIQAVDYLKPHKMIVQIDEMCVADALNTLAELNEWRWVETDKGVLLIMRPLPRMPQSYVEASAALQSVLPKAFRTFLGVGVSPDAPENDRERRLKEAGAFDGVTNKRIEKRISTLINKHLDMLRESINQQDKEAKQLSYAKMTPDQKESLLIALVGGALGELNLNHYYLVRNHVYPYQLDTNKAEITVKNGLLNIGATSTSANGKGTLYMGFGVGIPGLPSTPPKIPVPERP